MLYIILYSYIIIVYLNQVSSGKYKYMFIPTVFYILLCLALTRNCLYMYFIRHLGLFIIFFVKYPISN